jgi:hypothetical protein
MTDLLLLLLAFLNSILKERRDLTLPEPCFTATVSRYEAEREASCDQEKGSPVLGLVIAGMERMARVISHR